MKNHLIDLSMSMDNGFYMVCFSEIEKSIFGQLNELNNYLMDNFGAEGKIC